MLVEKGKAMLQRLLILGMVLLVSACSSDNNDDEANPVPNPMDVTLNVVSTLGVPIEGVFVNVLKGEGEVVAYSSVAATTDAEGTIIIQNVPEKSQLQFQLNKAGYANQVVMYRTPAFEQVATLSATMIEREAPIVFEASAEAALSGKDGAKLNVAADAFVDGAGNVVTGDIELHMTPVDISTPAGLAAFPGSFSGIMDDGGRAPVIVSLGTTEFEFSQGDEILQLAPGHTATIELPMYSETYPDGSQVQLGDEIPLWYLDEESGIWQQEGVGTVVANYGSSTGFAMRAEVGHFSWWNCDVAPETGEVNLLVEIDDPNNELANYDVSAIAITVTATANGFGVRQNDFFVGERVFGNIVPADTPICFTAHTSFDISDGVMVTQSDEVCLSVGAGDSENVDLVVAVKLNEFTLASAVPETATEGSEFGACGQQPKLLPQGYVKPVSYTILSGSLPRGLILHNNGSISGIPTRPWPGQVYSAHIEATDGLGRTARTIVDIDVSDPLTLRASGVRPVLRVGHEIEVLDMFTAEGGLESLSYRLATGGDLPPGMSFDETDASYRGTPAKILINGHPMLEYFTHIKVQVEDQNCAKAEAEVDQHVVYAPLLEGEPQNVEVGEQFSFTPINSGDQAVAWNIASHDVLSWASFDTTTGELSGVPGVDDVGIYDGIVVSADGRWNTNGVHINDVLSFSFEVTLQVPSIENQPGDFQVAVNQAVNYTPLNGGGMVERWEIINKPTWLNFDAATGAISGTPTAVATDSGIIIRAINRSGASETRAFSIDVTALVVAPALGGNAPAGTVGFRYLFSPINSGGLATAAVLSSGNLPTGISLNNSGELQGTPTQAGTFPVEITASNAGGSDTLAVTLVINPGQQAALAFADPGPVQKITTDVPFINAVSGGSGSGVIRYVSSDSGIATVNAISGEVTLLTSGQTLITATKAADANYLPSSVSYTLSVSGGGTISGVPGYILINTPYSFIPTVTGDTIVSWSIANNLALPDGLTLNAMTGEISGSATTTGQTSLVMRAVNGAGSVYEFAITLEVYSNASPSLWNETNFAICSYQGEMCGLDLIAGSAFSHRFISDSGPVESWSLSGILPAGLTLDTTTGVLSGSATETGDFFIGIEATNSIGSDFLNLLISVKQSQSPLTFADVGPIDKFNIDLPFINLATGGESTANITYLSSDSSVASVDYNSGEVTLLKPGVVTISARRGADNDYFEVSADYQLRVAMAAVTARFAVGSEQTVTAAWEAVDDAVAYNLYLSETTPVIVGGNGVQLFTDQSSPAVLEGLANDMPYFLAVEAVSDSNIISDLSNELSATPMSGQALTGSDAFANAFRLAGDVLVVRRSLHDAYATEAPLEVYEKIAGSWQKTQELPSLQDWWGKALAVHQGSDGSYRIAAGSDASSNFGNARRQGGLATYTKVEKDICGNDIDDDGNGSIDEASCVTVPVGTRYHNGIWQQEGYQTGAYAEQLALGDDVMVVARPSSDVCDANVYNCGQIDVYRINAGSWSMPTQTLASPRSDLDHFNFGFRIILSDSVLLASAPGNVNSDCAGNCAAYVYRDDGNAFALEATLTPGSVEGDSFGYSVALSGDTIAIGDPSVVLNGGAVGGDGALYLYQKGSGELWNDGSESSLFTSPVHDVLNSAQNFAYSAALSSDLLVVGDIARNCMLEGTVSDVNCGTVYLYPRQSDGSFSALTSQAVMEQTTVPNTFFGHELILDGGNLGISSYEPQHMGPGRVTIYPLP